MAKLDFRLEKSVIKPGKRLDPNSVVCIMRGSLLCSIVL